LTITTIQVHDRVARGKESGVHTAANLTLTRKTSLLSLHEYIHVKQFGMTTIFTIYKEKHFWKNYRVRARNNLILLIKGTCFKISFVCTILYTTYCNGNK
jgi:hypothetical protein